jgi:tyrosyl-tRNA synthetase
MNSQFVSEIKWRGLLHNISAGTEEYLKNNTILGYIGFDATAPSLHIGNLVPIAMLRHLQNAGHRPVVVIGGATSMIGDPSGRSSERVLLNHDQILTNQIGIESQFKLFLDFDDKKYGALILNNLDWYTDFNILSFLRDVSKYISVNYMMAKDSVKNRLDTGISFTEFSYQLLQAYDFFHLYHNYGVKLQMGGADQWGNLTTGTELLRKKGGVEDAFLITAPLITKADGSKFGKSQQGNIWLNPKMTSPYNFYQYWINCSDEDAIKFTLIFSKENKKYLDELIEYHIQIPHKRIVQNYIAKELTSLIHSVKCFEQCKIVSEILFDKSFINSNLQTISEDTLNFIAENIPCIEIEKNEYNLLNNVIDLLSVACNGKIFESKSQAKRHIQERGVFINKLEIDLSINLKQISLMFNRYILVQKGKNNYFIIKLV